MAAVVALAAPSSARADDGPRSPDWAFASPAAEGVLAGTVLASNATLFLSQRRSNWRPDHVRAPVRSLALASDIVGAGAGAALQIGAGYWLETAYLAKHRVEHPGIFAARSSLVETEALALDAGVTSLIKRLSGRCRPWGYRGAECVEHDAFPSGHTSAIAAIAGARLVRAMETPLDDSALGARLVGLGLAEAATLTTAILRVTSGAHSGEDVAVGALVGHATGVLVALMHPVTAPRELPPSTRAPAKSPTFIGLTWGGRF